MSVDTMRQPDVSMGHRLMAFERRDLWIMRLKIALVQIAVLIIAFAILLLLKFDPGYIIDHRDIVLQGVPTTIRLSLISIVFASILAFFGALGRVSNNPIALGVSGLYVSAIRGTPLIIQIFLIYNGLPQIGQQLNVLVAGTSFAGIGNLLILKAFTSGVLALSLNYGAYMTEIFRAGLQSIGHGQREAAQALGMTPWQALWRITLPQAVRIIIPDIGNQFIAMQKDSALVSFMGVSEILWLATRFARRDQKFLEMYLLAALLYWILTIISSWLQSRLEQRMAHAYER